MGGGTTWWLATGIVLGSSAFAGVAALSDSVRHRMHLRRLRHAPVSVRDVPGPGGAPFAFPTSSGHPTGAPPPAVPRVQPAPAVAAPASARASAVVPARAAIPGGVAAPVVGSRPGTGSGSDTGSGASRAEVRLLGPCEVRGPGAAPGAHRGELTALVVLAAMLPSGVPAGLANELLPQGAETADGQLREWLGVDASGVPRLAERGGAWSLSADVRVDWHTFRELVNAPGAAGEVRRLASALALVRGELVAGVSLPSRAQRILEPILTELRTMVVRAVRRDIELAVEADDPARAEWALRQGLTLLPREERLRRL